MRFQDFLGKSLRILPDFRGKRRVGRYVLGKSNRKISETLVNGNYNCSYLLPNLNETIGFEIFANGIYEQGTHDFLMKNLPIGSTFLDLGANLGTITIPLIRRRPDIKAICVEASPWIFRYLLHNISINKLNITCINKAIWNISKIKKQFFSPKDHYGKGSFSAVFTSDQEMVETITIEDILKHNNISSVDFIKIDIEGYEFFAFDGFKNLFMNPIAPDILFEFVDWAEELAGVEKGAAQSYLQKCGYQLYKLHDLGRLELIAKIVTTGSFMLFATKKALPN